MHGMDLLATGAVGSRHGLLRDVACGQDLHRQTEPGTAATARGAKEAQVAFRDDDPCAGGDPSDFACRQRRRPRSLGSRNTRT